MKTAEFGQPIARLPQPGMCRVCACTEISACRCGDRWCGWADHTRTLCDNPACVAEAKREIGR